MSLGTADQLYLALRLATLEAYLDRREPLPLVVDDILIQFDNARTSATLSALAALATDPGSRVHPPRAPPRIGGEGRSGRPVLFTHELPVAIADSSV